jgi:hypothetical protein
VVYYRRGEGAGSFFPTKGAKMSEEVRVLWITFDEAVADFLTEQGEAASFWERKLSELKLEEKEELVYRILIPYAMLGIGLGYLRENPHVELATVGARKPRVPWWARVKQLALPYFTESMWVITFNEDADLRRYLRQAR